MFRDPTNGESEMTLRSKLYPTVKKLTDLFGNWLEHRREVREMRELEPNQFTGIARELGITPDDLDTFVSRGPQAVDELPKLLRALGIDETALARNQPLVLRDMKRVCAACQQKASVQPGPQRRYHRRKFRAVLPLCVDDRRIG